MSEHSLDDTVRALAILLADRIEADRPGEPMAEVARIELCAELADGEQPLYGQLLAATVVPRQTGTRALYAAALRRQVGVR
ncbi:hypothetical protein AB0F46_18670 [Streptomyces sp. NPDC026665]|uniref:hypothetical protein n=1 Tax=Streptomyces sp. NPDC026665 TaxID=3154798 RepID=UPI0033CE9B46